jgi:hypothetical protein
MSHLALLLMGTSGLAMWLTAFQHPWPIERFGLLCVPLSLVIAVWVLSDVRPALGRHLLVWGLIAVLLAAMWLLSEPRIPFLSALLSFVGAMLVSGSERVSMAIVATLAAWWTHSGARTYPLLGLFPVLALGTVLACLTVRTVSSINSASLSKLEMKYGHSVVL